MAITVEQWGEVDIQTATFVSRLILSDATRDRAAQPITANPLSGFPRVTRSQQQGQVVPLHIEVVGGARADIESLMTTFRVGTTDVLIVDWDGTRRSLEATVQRVRPWQGSKNVFRVFLFAPDPRWRSELGQSDPLRAITVSPTDFTITNDGTGIEDQARFYLRPFTLKSAADAQRFKFEIPVAWRANRAASNYPVELTDGGWDHATEVAAGRSLASGDDVRVLQNGVEIPRFDGGGATSSFDDALTKIWVNPTFSSRQQAALRANATATSPANGEDLEVDPGGTVGWASSGFLKINNEVIQYSGTTESNEAGGHAAFLNIKRAERETTAASHTAGDDLFFVEHRFQIMYGHTGAAPPPDWSAFEPLINRDTSTNSMLIWDSTFSDEANPARSLPWLRRFTQRDTLSDKIIASSGSPDAVLDLEYQTEGAQTGQPVANEWFRDFPVGLRTSAAGAITFRDSNIATDNDTGTLTLTKPTGTVDGDVMLTFISHVDTTPTITTLAGWTLVDSLGLGGATHAVAVYSKVASSEPASYAWTVSTGGTSETVGVVAAYDNVDNDNPIMANGTILSSNGTAIFAPSLFADQAGSVCVVGYGQGAGRTVVPNASYTELEDGTQGSASLEVSHALGLDRTWQNPEATVSSSSSNMRTASVILRPISALTFTTTVSDTLAALANVVDDQGTEAQAVAVPGPITAQAGSVPAGSDPIISVALGARSQVVARNPAGTEEDETTIPAAYDTVSQQQFTAPANGVVRAIAVTIDVDVVGPITCSVWSDDGSDAFLVQISEEIQIQMDATGDGQQALIGFQTPPTLVSGQIYWIRLQEEGPITAQWKRVATPYGSGISGVSGNTFRFQVQDILMDNNQADAIGDDGDTVTYSAITAHLQSADGPSIVFAGSQGQDAYFLETKLRNLTTGIQEIALSRLLNPLDMVEIDIGERAIRNLTDGPLAVQTAGTVTFDAVASTPASSVLIATTDGRVQIQSRYVDVTQFIAIFRFKMGWNGGSATHDPGIFFHLAAGASDFIQGRWDDANLRWELERRTTAGTSEVTVADTIATNDLITVFLKGDEDNVSMSIDGANFVDVANTRFPDITATLMDLGSDGTSSSQLDSGLLWSAFGKGKATNAQAADVDALGDVDPDFDDFHADLGIEAIWWANDKTYLATGFSRGPSVVGRHDEGQVFSDRARWLDLEDGANVIQLEETGLAGVNVDTRYVDRWE